MEDFSKWRDRREAKFDFILSSFPVSRLSLPPFLYRSPRPFYFQISYVYRYYDNVVFFRLAGKRFELNVEKDVGETRATSDAFLCLYFARGKCVHVRPFALFSISTFEICSLIGELYLCEYRAANANSSTACRMRTTRNACLSPRTSLAATDTSAFSFTLFFSPYTPLSAPPPLSPPSHTHPLPVPIPSLFLALSPILTLNYHIISWLTIRSDPIARTWAASAASIAITGVRPFALHSLTIFLSFLLYFVIFSTP